MNDLVGCRFFLKEMGKKDKFAYYECVSVDGGYCILKKVLKTKLAERNILRLPLSEMVKKPIIHKYSQLWSSTFNASGFYTDTSARWLRREGKLFG